MSRSTWALVELAHAIAGHFDRGWRALPAPAIRAWARSILAGIIVTFVTLTGLIIYGKSRLGLGGRLTWEVELLRQIELHSPIGFSGAVWFQTFGTDIVLVLVVLTAASVAMWRERPLLGLSILLSMVMMDAAVRIGWLSWERVRPDIIAQGIARPGEHSFPSGHTAKSLAVYGLLISQWIRTSRNIIEKILAGLLFLVIAIGTPFGRIRMGVHWPTDVMGGWIIGSVWLTFLFLALKHAERKQFIVPKPID
jgi:undecaprenyl-diphosphatase